MSVEPIEIVEIDIDYCSRSFGVAPCMAVLGGLTVRKCYNTFYTCADKANYSKGVKTYRFIQSRADYPVGATVFPCLVSTSGRSATVNIAGSDTDLDSLGRRGEMSADFFDFPFNDRFADKYQIERVSGAAQIDETGYNPRDRGSFWTKFKRRNPNYAGRPMRLITGYLENGALTITATRHSIITQIDGPDDAGRVTIKGQDILKLADDDRAVCPKPSQGYLSTAIGITVGDVVTLLPVGIGADYAASGFASIGSELVGFTRAGDVVTITARGVSGTTVSAHGVNDTFQQSYSPRLQRIDAVLYDLLVNYAKVPSAFIPFAAWQAEVQRWAPSLLLTTDILKPEGVKTLVGELAVLGVSIWWDDVLQQVGLKINRPPDTDIVKELSDDNNIMAIRQEDREDDRLTQVLFNSVLIDPSKSASDKSNYSRGQLVVDADASSSFAYNDTRIKEINCRWLNHGNDSLIRVLAIRLLKRFNKQPVRFYVELDVKDNLSLTDVARLISHVKSDDTGKPDNQLVQIISREDIEQGHSYSIVAQSFAFDARYGYITENTRPSYTASNTAQKNRGAYMVGPSLAFADGLGAYRFS